MQNKQPICIQLGAMKSGTTFLSELIKEHSNKKVENISILDDKDTRSIDTDYYANSNLYLRRNLFESNEFLKPLLNKTSSPIIILLRNPFARFISHLNHHIIKMHALNKEINKLLVPHKISNNKYEYSLKLVRNKNIINNDLPPLSKGLYYSILNPIIKDLDESRLFFINTASLKNKSTLIEIVKHIKKYNNDFNMNFDNLNLERKNNTKDSMRKELQRGFFKRKLPDYTLNISEENRQFINELFLGEHQKLITYKSYKIMSRGKYDF